MRTLTALLALALSTSAFAGEGDDVLMKLDRSIGNFTDSTIVFEVQNLKPGMSAPQAMKFKAVVKGSNNYTEFLAPGDVKGTRVLATSATNMWVFLPEFNKIRKVASHTLAQGFMGTTLSQQDIGTTGYATDYSAEIIAQDDATYTLKLEAKDPKAVGYPHLKMVIDKKKMVPLTIQYLSDTGDLLRTQTRGKYTCPKPDYCMFGELKMVDHTRGDAWTSLSPIELTIDAGVSEDIFTPRTLQLGL